MFAKRLLGAAALLSAFAAHAQGPATESVANPYGHGALWAQGDFVAKGTLVIMVIMSLGLSLIHI